MFFFQAEQETRRILKSSIKDYYASADKADFITLSWNHLQAGLQCCGVDNYRDFEESAKWSAGDKKIPESCCVLRGDPLQFTPLDQSCTTNPSEANSYYMKGCYQAVINWVMSHTNIVIGVGVGLALVELLGIFLAFCLSKNINSYIK